MKIIFIAIAALSISHAGFSQLSIDEQALGSCILIECTDGTSGSGLILEDSGFVYILTARHVIFKDPINRILRSDSAKITAYGRAIKNSNANILNVSLKGENIGRLIGDDIANDAAVIMIAKTEGILTQYVPYINKTLNKVISEFSSSGVRTFDKVSIGQDAFILGYPKSIGLNMGQLEANKPLMIKGIIAGKNETNKRIILNAQVYHGNSGGPVYAYFVNEQSVLLVGVVTELIPYLSESLIKDTARNAYKMDSTHAVFNNTNFSVIVPIEYFISLAREIRHRIE